MARNRDGWMEFRGVGCAQMGVQLVSLPDRHRAGLRSEAVDVPGRHGRLHMKDEGYEGVQMRVGLRTMPGASRLAVSDWLVGSGDLRFYDAPEYVYRAYVRESFSYERFARGMDNMDVVFDCEPFLYEHSPKQVQLVSGGVLVNPGTVEADPVIALYGSGDMALMISGKSMLISGAVGGVVIDSGSRMAYSLSEENVLMTGSVSGDWPRLSVGNNVISWTGATSASIMPNWRWL